LEVDDEKVRIMGEGEPTKRFRVWRTDIDASLKEAGALIG
jgi:hypothetical protein